MSYVTLRPGESFDSLMKRFKKSVENSGVLADFRKSEFFEKPSIKKKRKSAAARKRATKERKKLERRVKPNGKNFRWNADHTEKLPMRPPRQNNDKLKNKSFKPYRKPQQQSRNYNKGNKS